MNTAIFHFHRPVFLGSGFAGDARTPE